MPRIRSIKPEFWTDATVADLSAECALFFIALWNFATDQGVFENDSRALSLLIPRYRSQVVQHLLSSLWKSGLIARSRDARLWLVTGWAHQKIDKPKAGKWNPSEIEWVSWEPSPNDRESSPKSRRKDRIGSDRKGSDHGSGSVAAPPAPSPGSKLWGVYEIAYHARYGVEPSRNAQVNSQLSNLAKRLGEDAAGVIRFYLTHNGAYYVRCQHTVGPMLKDAEALHTQWKRGQAVLGTQAREVERQAHNSDTWDQAAAILNERRRANEAQ